MLLLRQRTLTRVMVRYNCVSNQTRIDLCVARRPATRGNVRNVNATVLYIRLIRTATRVNGRCHALTRVNVGSVNGPEDIR